MKHTGKKFYQRTAAFLSALVLTASFAGCSKNNNQNQDNGGNSGGTGSSKAAQALNISFDHSYASEQIEIDSSLSLNTMTEFNGNLLLSGYNYDDLDTGTGNYNYIYNIESGTMTPVELAYPKTLAKNVDYYIMTSFVNAQNQPVFVYHTSSYDEKNEDNPYQDLGYTMEIYDENFNVIETKELNDMLDENVYFSNMIQDQTGNFYVAAQDGMTGQSAIYIYDKDFKKTGQVDSNIQYIQQMFINKDGKIVLNYQDSEWNNCFGFLNTDTNALDTIQVEGMPQWFNLSFEGKKDYDLFVADSTAAYGIKLEAGTCEEVINWVNSDFIGDSVGQAVQLADGRFIIIDNDYTSNEATSSIWLLNERDPKEFENVQLISLATLWMPTTLGKAVNTFNRTHSDYRIGVMDYDKYSTEEDYQAGLKKFEEDMTSGIVADIICLSYMPYERYANKGLLMDFSDYINQLNPDEYFTNFFDSLRYGDKLYRIGFSYNAASLEAKTDKVNGKSGLSLQEFTDLVTNLPDGMEAFSEVTKESALSELAVTFINNFIDLNTGACTFNSPEFVKLLELCNSYPSDEDDNRQDWEQEDWEKYWAEENYQYINDKVLFREAYINDVRDYFHERAQYFGDSDVTLVGFPTATEGSNGGKFAPDYTISASANSAVKDQIWEFCQQMLSEESQEHLNYELPVRKEAFDKLAANALKPETYYDEEGNQKELDYMSIWRGEEETHVPLPTQADVDKLKSYIENMKDTVYYNEQVYNIISEEAQKYFSGDQTSQAAADMIQSRVSIYLSEQT
ncbi:MAG: carbohydrate ABC transporter substrate-binding protein [Oscillospiraceae bacterium]|nr:carbohydrate ABC transporter substrate-binding protein [Oscillospiraceae bacterium]